VALIHDPSSETRKATSRPTSFGVPSRPTGMAAKFVCSASARVTPAFRYAGV
jgi:hypothetical protein